MREYLRQKIEEARMAEEQGSCSGGSPLETRLASEVVRLAQVATAVHIARSASHRAAPAQTIATGGLRR